MSVSISRLLNNIVISCFQTFLRGTLLKDENIILYSFSTKLWYFSFILKSSSLFYPSASMDITVTDSPINANFRFELIHSFWLFNLKKRIFFKFFLNNNPVIVSINSIFSSASWLEREIWDMYGIKFILNNDLRRVLTDYGFKGYPLRKEFPLSGYIESNYNDVLQTVDFTVSSGCKDFVTISSKILDFLENFSLYTWNFFQR